MKRRRTSTKRATRASANRAARARTRRAARPVPAPEHAVTFVIVIHDHQPVGNFDGVFEHAYRDAYAPFLEFLAERPHVRLALHTSGPLLQWIALHHPEYLARLRELVERDQIELWGGGFYEPILPAIDEVDRRGQIHAMAEWLDLELGRRPRGAWLAERVWEPGLASSLADAGVEFTAVDDAHFVAAGFERDALWGHYTTEDRGRAIGVFPIHRELRYLMPFEAPERTIEMLRRVANAGPGRIAVHGDDGEKFGIWPGTHDTCYRKGWLARFSDLLLAHPWIELRTPSEAFAHHAPAGLAYLPTASYHEMQEWALPPAAQARYHRAAARLQRGFGDTAHDLLRGGHWRNFLARYPESNRMHKRALRASTRLWSKADESDAQWKEARTRLWRAQCNCPYWHGVFGGLYLPHLRSAVYHELLAAESHDPPTAPRIERGDVDLDGHDDALLETREWAAWISTEGGRLWGFDDRTTLTNYGDTLARRPEAYHHHLAHAASGAAGGGSIHSAVRLKDRRAAKDALVYDAHGRDRFVDRWREGRSEHAWAGEVFLMAEANGPAVVLATPETDAPALEKRYAVGADGTLEVVYALVSSRARRGRLTVELNWGLHVPKADDRFVEVDGRRATRPHFSASVTHRDARTCAFVDRWADRRLEVRSDRPATLARAPIWTVSLSEAGAERVFQGVETRFTFAVELEPRTPWHVRFRVAAGRAGTRSGAAR